MKKLISTLALGAALSTPALAAGPYVAVDVGDYGSSRYSPLALAISGGMQLSRNAGFEVGYVAAQDYDYVWNGGLYTFDQSVIKGAGVLTLPLNNQVDLFGKLGMALVRWSDTGVNNNYLASGSSLNLMFGFGGQFHLNRQLAVRGQYEYFGRTVGLSNGGNYVYTTSSMLSVGAVYSF